MKKIHVQFLPNKKIEARQYGIAKWVYVNRTKIGKETA